MSNQTAVGGGTTGPELFVRNVDGSGSLRRVTDTTTGASRAPAWSPDGATIAYESNSDGTLEVFTIPAATTAGTGTRRSANAVGVNYQNPSWSPSGARIAFEAGTGTATSDTTKEIWTMDPDGTDPVQLTSNSVYDAQPAYSPDGTRIAFQSSADGDQEIYTMDPSPLAPARTSRTPHRASRTSCPTGAIPRLLLHPRRRLRRLRRLHPRRRRVEGREPAHV